MRFLKYFGSTMAVVGWFYGFGAVAQGFRSEGLELSYGAFFGAEAIGLAIIFWRDWLIEDA